MYVTYSNVFNYYDFSQDIRDVFKNVGLGDNKQTVLSKLGQLKTKLKIAQNEFEATYKQSSTSKKSYVEVCSEMKLALRFDFDNFKITVEEFDGYQNILKRINREQNDGGNNKQRRRN
jgi:formate-dependent phosphoribosylglycinamide formyltransferase (GAR transformylase)